MPEQQNLLSEIYVKIDGQEATAVTVTVHEQTHSFMDDLLEVTVENSLHLPDVATLVLNDSALQWIDKDTLAPGKTVQVSAKAGQAEHKLFDGEIVELEPDYSPSTQKFVIRAFDRLHRLSRGRQVATYLNMTDSDIASKIASKLGLSPEVDATSQVHEFVMQKNETHLEFLQARASLIGYLVWVDERKLHFKKPPPTQGPIELNWGETFNEFHPRLTTIGQVDTFTVRSWDPKNKQAIVGSATSGGSAPKVGVQPGGSMSSSAFGSATALMTHSPLRSQGLADNLAQSVADSVSGKYIEAEATCSGNPQIVAGATVDIKNVGTRFSGKYVVTSATHHYSADHGFTTNFSVSGHHPSTLLSVISGEAEHSKRTTELMIGIVTDNNDSEGLGRVKVKYPSLADDHTSDWARVVAPGIGADRGITFLPEVNDEVLVGFEMGDVNQAYVLGGIWNGKDKPPRQNGDSISGQKVVHRIIQSRAKHYILLDDTEGAGGITIQDAKGNQIMIESNTGKLTIKVQGDVKVEATGKIDVTSKQAVTVTAQSGLTLEAQSGQVQIKGMGVSIDGGAATVDVKGTMINLN